MSRDLLRRAFNALDERNVLTDEEKDLLGDIDAELAKPLPEPVSYQFRDTDGSWHDFINPDHYKNTVKDGRWPIRALYTSAPEQKPLNQPGQLSINIIHDPANKTQFNRGDIIGYEGSPNKLLVVGESEAYLHTFVVDSGDYWGIFKAEENLSCLIRKSIDTEQSKSQSNAI